MDVRKYEALTMQDAIKLIKKELGKDAVILGTREKDKEVPGVPGNRVRVVEVVAARAAAQAGGGESASANDPNVRPVSFPRVNETSDVRIVRGSPTLSPVKGETTARSPQGNPRLAALQERLSAPLQDKPASQAARSYAQNDMMHAMQSQDYNQAKPSSPAASLAAQAPAQPIKELVELREELSRMRKEMEALPQINMGHEVQEIKILLHDIMRSRPTETPKKHPEYLTNIAVRLRAAGVVESLLSDLMETVHGMPLPKGPDGSELPGEKLKEFYINAFIRLLFKEMNVTGPLKLARGEQNIFCLVGPTGVGKTTTIAKLAAHFKLTDRSRVALVSMDSFRIAGADQLRVYSRILDCPFAEVSEPDELVDHVQKFRDFDYILVDTAGRSARHLAQMQNLQALKQVDVPVHFHLALSSTMKQRDIDENIRAFRFLMLESVLFTKLDESWNYGEILNTAVKSRIPLSYFATGQRVPEDLEVATKEQVIERLFQI